MSAPWPPRFPLWSFAVCLFAAGCDDPHANTARVCINKSLASIGLHRIDLPTRTLFKDGGEFEGEAIAQFDKITFKPSTIDPNAAFATDRPVTLTDAQPCADVAVQMWAPVASAPRSETDLGHIWDLERAMGSPPTVAGQPSRVGDAAGSIAVRAKLLGAVVKWFEAAEDDVARADPDNPMSRIDADGVTAEALPQGVPNLRVCLSTDVDDDPQAAFTIRAGTIFESWGPASGDERDPGMDSRSLALEAEHKALVITKAVRVTRASPCANAMSQALLSRGFRWRMPLTRASEHLQFQAYGIEGRMPPPPTMTAVDNAIASGIINARPIADIGHPRQIAGDDE